jgi:hypothetical protein
MLTFAHVRLLDQVLETAREITGAGYAAHGPADRRRRVAAAHIGRPVGVADAQTALLTPLVYRGRGLAVLPLSAYDGALVDGVAHEVGAGSRPGA